MDMNMYANYALQKVERLNSLISKIPDKQLQDDIRNTFADYVLACSASQDYELLQNPFVKKSTE